MQYRKSKFKKYSSLFTPSALSIIIGVFLSGLVIVLNQFAVIKSELQLPQNLQFGRMIAKWVDNLLTNTISQARTEILVVGLFWAIVGLVVYMFLHGLARFILELDDDLDARRYVWPKGTDRYRPLRILAEQAAFRLVALIILGIVIAGPLSAVIRGPIFADFLGPSKPLQYVVWFIGSVAVWHLVAILLRLIALRARVFD
jgi:hypothetical protein